MCALEECSIAQLIDQNMVVIFDDGFDEAEIGHPGGREDEAGSVQELSDLIFELSVVPMDIF